ncbi:MAG: hypothetical protein A4E39_01683 [Methanoregulaceae archaeon PtaB.Bin152]|nr:MAG: hypothetical protein A4E39_01683 [Methanoregulaceae archaeon PtaB.Bin152]
MRGTASAARTGGTNAAAKRISSLANAPESIAALAPRKGKSGPQSITFPVGKAVIGSNHA